PFGDGDRLRLLSARLEQTLEYHPPVAHIAVDRQVDPADAPMCDAPLDVVLTGHQFAGLQLWREREQRAAMWAHPFTGPRPAPVTSPSDRLPAAAAVPLRFGENRIG